MLSVNHVIPEETSSLLEKFFYLPHARSRLLKIKGNILPLQNERQDLAS
jgi:hypothetical protein